MPGSASAGQQGRNKPANAYTHCNAQMNTQYAHTCSFTLCSRQPTPPVGKGTIIWIDNLRTIDDQSILWQLWRNCKTTYLVCIDTEGAAVPGVARGVDESAREVELCLVQVCVSAFFSVRLQYLPPLPSPLPPPLPSASLCVLKRLQGSQLRVHWHRRCRGAGSGAWCG